MHLMRLVFVVALMGVAAASKATVTYTFSQVDPTTVSLTTSGSVDLSGVQIGSDSSLPPLFIYQTDANYFLLSGSGRHDTYRRDGQFILQESFATGPFSATATNAMGNFFGINQRGAPEFAIRVPTGYVSGGALSGSQEYQATTLSDLRLRAGTFTWVYGSTSPFTFIFQIPGNSVGGTVSGLNDAVTLQLNGANDFVVNATGAFTFPQELVFGDNYSVSVLQQPTGQTCTPASAKGTISGNVNDVAIGCINNNYPIGGVVLGLMSGESLVLQNNGGDDLSIGIDGNYEFPTPLPFGSSYNVSVLTQPASEICTVLNPTGTVATLNNNIIVNCAPATFTVSGTVAGLVPGETVTLRNNGADDQVVAGSAGFIFSSQANGSAYNVSVATEPAGKACTVTGGSGLIPGADVSGVSVSCTALSYPIGGSVSGLVAGDSVVLRNNGGDDLTLGANGSFVFATPVSSGSPYNVTVRTQPAAPSETCLISNASGTTPAGGVSNVVVTCTVDTFPVSGDVLGLASGNSIALRLNGADEQVLTGDGVFVFTPLADGTSYTVTISSQPAGQTCSVANGSGTLAGTSVTSVAVSCVDNSYSVGGLVSGLVFGDSLVLQNSGGDDLTLSTDGAFTFPTPVSFGDVYAVSVLTQPPAPSETCTVSGGANNDGSGTMAASDVSSIAIICSVDRFAVGGSLSGLASGVSLILQNNGSADLTLTADGNFRFPDQADGSAFAISVGVQSDGQNCTVSGGSGSLSGADVIGVAVVCADLPEPVAPPTAVPTMPRWLLLLAAFATALLVYGWGRPLSPR
ncbi:MAG: hypothetical protein ABJL54_07500 [Halioglobus sp.]